MRGNESSNQEGAPWGVAMFQIPMRGNESSTSGGQASSFCAVSNPHEG